MISWCNYLGRWCAEALVTGKRLGHGSAAFVWASSSFPGLRVFVGFMMGVVGSLVMKRGLGSSE